MALTKVKSGIRTLGTGEVTASDIESSLDLSSKTVTLPAASVTAHVTAFDDNVIQNNIAMLAFKVASGDSLTKFNMVDQVIDEFTDSTGIDTANSTNENREGGYINGAVYSGWTVVTNPNNSVSNQGNQSGALTNQLNDESSNWDLSLIHI